MPIYQTAPRSPKKGAVLCLVGLLILCIAGGIWGFRRSSQRGDVDLESMGIVIAAPSAEPVEIIDESTYSHIDPQERPQYVRQGVLVRDVYNRMGRPR